jgi:hypothetical protein
MAYAAHITVADLGSFFPTGNPPFAASLTVPLNAAPIPAAPGGAPSLFSFPVTASPPTQPGAILVADASGPGDIFRSGPIISWPNPPAEIMAYTVPLGPTTAFPSFAGVGRFTYAALATLVAAKLPTWFDIPPWVEIPSLFFTGSKFNPARAWISTVSFMQSTTGPGIIRALFGGWFDDSAGENGVNFTGSVDLRLAASGDASDHDKVIAITAFNVSLVVDPFGATPVGWALFGLLAPLLAGELSDRLSDYVNDAIASTAAGVNLVGIAPGLTPTWTLSARSITVAPGGITVQLIASDIARDRWLIATVTPQPAATTAAVSYTVTVEDSATHAAIAGANVTLHAPAQTGSGASVSGATDHNGQAVLDIALTTKRTDVVISTDPDRGKPQTKTHSVVEHSTITVVAGGYTTMQRPLV